SFATQAYPKITVTTRATGRTLKRNIESARPASSANLTSYTTSWDATEKRVKAASKKRDRGGTPPPPGLTKIKDSNVEGSEKAPLKDGTNGERR
ncbi:hypothetical protein, partial [Sphingosinicella sp.]|uniref:hypothetical protein n=1 Tax=Sphingosinicella sp. TaxID=1917971 RepID=UPI002622BC7A